VGARVERGEVIAEVETDKATMELEAFASGTLLEIRVAAGTNVPVGTVIGVIGEPAEQPAVPSPAATVVASPAPAQVAPEPAPVSASSPSLPAVPAGAAAADEIPAAPVVRRRAQELGIDLHTVRGSGPGGRILLDDLQPHSAERPAAVPPDSGVPVLGPAGPPAGESLSRMRQAIVRTVSESWRTIPHFSVTVEARMGAAEQFRRQHQTGDRPVSMTALLVRAAAVALAEFPRLNASLADERLVEHPAINIGIVVRQDDGLLVPVLHDCNDLALAETARRVGQLVERARHGQLTQSELSGGTFAISNLGMYNVHSFVALIMPPMAAVLAVGAMRDAVVVEAGQAVVARLMALTLSADHRIVDGVYAAEFLARLRQLLETPALLAGA
jgi:pyruvate dehydrogenase E2 component (dihydrolipoamide acetyltransferase)